MNKNESPKSLPIRENPLNLRHPRSIAKRRTAGFTMVEILVTIAIGGVFIIMAYIAISRFFIIQDTFSKNIEQTAERIILSLLLKDGTVENVQFGPNNEIIFYYHKLRADTIAFDIKKNIAYKNNRKIQFDSLDLKSYQLIKGKLIRFRINFNNESYEWNYRRTIPVADI